MDIGASYRGYSADVTRTIPVNGTFTADQRAIYQLVRDAQAAAERQARPGARAQTMVDSSSLVVARGLARLGLIERADATYDCEEGGQRGECPQASLFYMHGLGHGIGLDVHDPEQYYFTGTIAEGSAFTIEPGVYVRENLLDILPATPRNRALIERIRPAVERYRNIGVRIEDDYIVTAQGVEWISRAPREIDEIEAAMREPWNGPAPRRPELVEWYRATAPGESR
jgi:Xaa-Pro aminopeptidase